MVPFLRHPLIRRNQGVSFLSIFEMKLVILLSFLNSVLDGLS
jgi:hypothetical protein